MKLKCIGGICDGMLVDIPEYHGREGDAVKVPNYPVSISEDWWKLKPQPVVTVNYLIYIIDVLKYTSPGHDVGFDKIEIWFLRPTNFTTLDAIQYQFRK